MSNEGRKYDTGKDRWDLLPLLAAREVVRVLGHGAAKYGEHNWMLVDRHEDRYFAACLRHLVAWRRGERFDGESGLHHLSHAGCCILFLLTKELESLGGWEVRP